MMRPNEATPEGRALGRELARLCDAELSGKVDDRCETCACRAGDHLANGSPETLMGFVKCVLERTPFWCHERDAPCAGWLAMRSPPSQVRKVPWGHVDGSD